ncbi:MAG: hypothetical protein LBK29_02675 [Oscillospiraceae bacterium]|jgi:hypothetical protein|nr:hypothetical protein [Oscillospiraceae bacterium]
MNLSLLKKSSAGIFGVLCALSVFSQGTDAFVKKTTKVQDKRLSTESNADEVKPASFSTSTAIDSLEVKAAMDEHKRNVEIKHGLEMRHGKINIELARAWIRAEQDHSNYLALFMDYTDAKSDLSKLLLDQQNSVVPDSDDSLVQLEDATKRSNEARLKVERAYCLWSADLMEVKRLTEEKLLVRKQVDESIAICEVSFRAWTDVSKTVKN